MSDCTHDIGDKILAGQRQCPLCLAADLATAERLLKLIQHWADSKCPCNDGKPDPCPLCDATVSAGVCKALEGTLPESVAGPMVAFLARDKDRP